jgi:hypothetical protein
MVRKILDVDREEFVAWLRGKPKQVAVPPPPPNRATKTFVLTAMTRDVVVIPPTMWPTANSLNVRSAPLDRK